MPDELRASLATLVGSVARPPVDAAKIEDATGLLGGGLDLDSLSMLELVVGLEGLGVVVPPEDVTPAQFQTFGHLLAYVRARRVAGGGDPGGDAPREGLVTP